MSIIHDETMASLARECNLAPQLTYKPLKGQLLGLFIDVEATGPKTAINFATEIGAVFINFSNGMIVSTFTMFMPLQYNKKWDPVCYANFWNSNDYMRSLYARTIKGIESQTRSTGDIMEMFIKWFRSFADGNNVSIYSDNPSFDVAWFNYYLPEGIEMTTLTGTFKPTVDTRSFFCGISQSHPNEGMIASYAPAGMALGFQHQGHLCLPAGPHPTSHTHIALEDAIQLAITTSMFLNRMMFNKSRHFEFV